MSRKFYDIPVGSKFKLVATGEEYVKVNEERISCCKIKLNAKKVATNEDVVLRPMDDVELIDAN